MLPISVVVITHAEAEMIGACLASAGFADELVVVDDHSADATAAIAARHGAVVLPRAMDGFATQKNFGIGSARNDWVLILDADERVSPELAAELRALPDHPSFAAFSIPFRNHLGRRWLRHGGLYPDRHVRLLDRRRARYGPREVHEMLDVDGPVGELRGDIVHLTYADLGEYRRKVRHYAALEAAWTAAPPGRLHATRVFLDRYVRRQGFRDGLAGLASAALLAYYQVLLRRHAR